jgi:sugar/nucleoside kinase (ribokinase family)
VENEKLILDFGEKIPYDSVEIVRATGNSGNASVSSARLGLSSSLLSYIGNDQNGKECLEELQKNNVDTSHVQTEIGKKTNYHYVLWYNVDRTILVKHENFSYELGEIAKPKWIYLTSLGENSQKYHDQIADFLEQNSDVKLAFQPGTFQMKMGAEKLSRIYKRADIFFCNVEEAQEILKTEVRDIQTLLREVSLLGPKIVVITDGISGAYAFDSTTKDSPRGTLGEMWFVPVYPGEPYERTGAGDAFSSTIVSAMALEKPLEEVLLWGPVNAMSVCLYVGAQKGLLTQEQILDYLAKASEDYKLRKI